MKFSVSMWFVIFALCWIGPFGFFGAAGIAALAGVSSIAMGLSEQSKSLSSSSYKALK